MRPSHLLGNTHISATISELSNVTASQNTKAYTALEMHPRPVQSLSRAVWGEPGVHHILSVTQLVRLQQS